MAQSGFIKALIQRRKVYIGIALFNKRVEILPESRNKVRLDRLMECRNAAGHEDLGWILHGNLTLRLSRPKKLYDFPYVLNDSQGLCGDEGI